MLRLLSLVFKLRWSVLPLVHFIASLNFSFPIFLFFSSQDSFLRQGLTMHPQIACNSLCRPSFPCIHWFACAPELLSLKMCSTTTGWAESVALLGWYFCHPFHSHILHWLPYFIPMFLWNHSGDTFPVISLNIEHFKIISLGFQITHTHWKPLLYVKYFCERKYVA